MDKLKSYRKEISCMAITLIVYCASVYIVGVNSATLLFILVPASILSIFLFNSGKPNIYNRLDNILTLLWWAIYVGLITLKVSGILPSIIPVGNEFTHWLWFVIVPFIIVIFTNKSTVKETFEIIGLRGNATKQPWKKKTLLICLVLTPFLLFSAKARFNITFAMLMETPIFLMIFPLVFILMMLMAGTTEEVFFRGILQRNIYNATRSQVIALLSASLLFALFHLPYAYFDWANSQGNFILSLASVITEQFATGLFVGIIYIRSSNLWTTIIIHSFINAVWVTATFFTENPIININVG